MVRCALGQINVQICFFVPVTDEVLAIKGTILRVSPEGKLEYLIWLPLPILRFPLFINENFSSNPIIKQRIVTLMRRAFLARVLLNMSAQQAHIL